MTVTRQVTISIDIDPENPTKCGEYCGFLWRDEEGFPVRCGLYDFCTTDGRCPPCVETFGKGDGE
jgi:hypothetical protein